MAGSFSEPPFQSNETENRQLTGTAEQNPSSTAATETVHAMTQNYADAAAEKSITHEFVEIDLTSTNDCYNLPVAAKVSRAIRNTFGEDDDRVIIAPRRGNAGIWRIETSNIDIYRPAKELLYEGVPLGTVAIKSEKITVKEDGQVIRKFQRSPHDLLITLRDADSNLLRHVTNDQILEKIVELGVGKIKKSVQRQIDRVSGEYTGNKYFVLENVLPENRAQIPDSFVFEVASIGKLKMWLNHRHQLRRCWFCGEKHDAVCKIREKVDELVSEREKMRTEEGIKIKTYSDSTLRYANQTSLQSDIDAMSGATLGNIINAIGVDTENIEIPNVILLSGTNEKKMTVTPAEYISSLKTIRERAAEVVKTKQNVAWITPPKPVGLLSPDEIARDEVFEKHIKQMEDVGVKVWRNPIEGYDEDWGSHPSIVQTADLLEYINKRVHEDFNVSYQLPSATKEVLALPTKYKYVTPLYKYGCGACGKKDRNRWTNICDNCKTDAQDEAIISLAEDFAKRVAEIEDLENPTLEVASDDDSLRCETCEVTFQEISDLRQHFKDAHPGTNYKRTKHNTTGDGKKGGRRVKPVPTKSITPA